jgi:hypothetical protein
LDAKKYRVATDFHKDIALMVANAQTYNRKGSDVYKDAATILV